MVGQRTLNPPILVRIQAREPYILRNKVAAGIANDQTPPISFKQPIFHALGQYLIWNLKCSGQLLVKKSQCTRKCYRFYTCIWGQFYFRPDHKFHPCNIQREICTYIPVLVKWKLDDVGYEPSYAWCALGNPDRKSDRSENSTDCRKSMS